MPQQQPMITVKKADGTIVKLTVREFEAYQKERMGMMSRQPLPQAGAASRPVKAISHGEAANDVLRMAGISLPPALVARAQSLILSRIKDVRTDDQFMATAMAPTDRGGLGLQMPTAEKLLRSVSAILPSPEHKMLKPKVFAVPAASRPDVPLGVERLPTATSPLLPDLSAEEAEEGRGFVGASGRGSNRVAGAVGRRGGEMEILVRQEKPPMTAAVGERPAMHDVVVPTPATLSAATGPVDEMARYTLTDFRRLGATPDAAASRIAEKFENMKRESYLLFMQARSAWYQSPLQTGAMSSVAQALRDRVKIADLLAATPGKERMTIEVFTAVIGVNKRVRM